MKWYTPNCLVGQVGKTTDSKCWLDAHSFAHASYPLLFYMILLFILSLYNRLSPLTNKQLLLSFITVNVIHIIDDSLNNFVGWSLESFYHKGKFYDKDSIQNFLGDILVALSSTGLMYFVLRYFHFVQFPHICIALVFSILFLTLCRATRAYHVNK